MVNTLVITLLFFYTNSIALNVDRYNNNTDISSMNNKSYTALLVTKLGSQFQTTEGIVISDYWILGAPVAIFSQMALVGDCDITNISRAIETRNVYYVMKTFSSDSYYGGGQSVGVVLIKLFKSINTNAVSVTTARLIKTKREGPGSIVRLKYDVRRGVSYFKYERVSVMKDQQCFEKIKDACHKLQRIPLSYEQRLCADNLKGVGWIVPVGAPIEIEPGQVIGLTELSEDRGGCPTIISWLGAYEGFIKYHVFDALWVN